MVPEAFDIFHTPESWDLILVAHSVLHDPKMLRQDSWRLRQKRHVVVAFISSTPLLGGDNYPFARRFLLVTQSTPPEACQRRDFDWLKIQSREQENNSR
jgi:hypothetical protein